MTHDLARLKAHYSALPDDELLAAAAAGRDAFRPEVWPLVTGELARRRLRVPKSVAPPRPIVDAARAHGRDLLGPWSLGMRVALLPALGAIGFSYGAVRHLVPLRGIAIAGAFGFGVWIGVGVLVDLVQHHAKRRRDRPRR